MASSTRKEEKQPNSKLVPALQRIPTHLRDQDRVREATSWQTLLSGIASLAKKRKLNKKVFISYAWPADKNELDKMQRWLKRLQDDLEAAGIHVFFDLRDMELNLKTTMQTNLEESDFVLPILTPRFLEQAENENTNLGFEFQLSLKKEEKQTGSLIPIRYAGQFGEVVKGALAPLMGHLIYPAQELQREHLLVALGDPKGLIPVIYGWRVGDKDYQALLNTWQANSLTRLPLPLPNAIERKAEMKQITGGFADQAKLGVSPVQVIQGMGGLGKSQLAVDYASQMAGAIEEKGGFVRWLYADTLTLATEWTTLGERLGLDLKGITGANQQRLIRKELSRRSHWLLVLDNVESYGKIKGLLPEKQTVTQQVLITSRSKDWRQFSVVSVSLFTPEQSHLYCKARLSPKQCDGMSALTEQLGHLPLALSHAVAYIQQSNITTKAYLERYKEAGPKLLSSEIDTEAKGAGYNETVLTTWQLSIERLASKNLKAANMVKACGYLAPEGIEESWLKSLFQLNDLEMDGCIRAIRDYDLLTRDGAHFKIHRLVQVAIRHEDEKTLLKENLFSGCLALLTNTLYEAYPFKKKTEDYQKALQFQPHLETISGFIGPLIQEEDKGKKSPAACQANLLDALGDLFLHVKGEAKEALCCYQKALAIQLKVHGEAHPYIAISYSNLGMTHQALGDAKEALGCDQKVLAMRLKNTYGVSYSNLGTVYRALGDAKKALGCQKKALAISLEVHGEAHPDVAISYNNLGVAYEALGEAKEALVCHHKALAIRLKVHGEAHPAVATSYSNLGNAHQTLGEAKKALPFHQAALAIRLKVHGEAHPAVATSYNNLGLAYEALGEAKEALVCHQKALAIRLKVHGEAQHPGLALSYRYLGVIYQDSSLKDHRKAKICLEKALAIYKKFNRQNDISNIQERLNELGSSVSPSSSGLTTYPGTLLAHPTTETQKNNKISPLPQKNVRPLNNRK